MPNCLIFTFFFAFCLFVCLFVCLLVCLFAIQGKFDLAESEVRTILKHDANSKEAEFILGRILEVKGLLKEAGKHFHKVLKKDYQHSGALAALERLSKKS